MSMRRTFEVSALGKVVGTQTANSHTEAANLYAAEMRDSDLYSRVRVVNAGFTGSYIHTDLATYLVAR